MSIRLEANGESDIQRGNLKLPARTNTEKGGDILCPAAQLVKSEIFAYSY